MPDAREGRAAAAWLGASILIGSLSFTLIKGLLEDLSPLTLSAGRVVFSAVCFAAVVTAQPGRRQPIRREDRALVWFVGLAGSAGFHICFTWGQQRASVAAATIVMATMPALAATGEALFLRHRPSPRTGAGLVLSLLGLVVITRTGAASGAGTSLAGIAALGAASLAWASVTVAQRRLAGRYDPWWLNTPGTLAGALLMAALAAPRVGELGGLGPLQWWWLIWLGAVSSAFIYAATTIAMRTLPATVVASSGTLVTPIAIVVAWAHLGERPSPGGVVGAVLVVAGVVLVGASSR